MASLFLGTKLEEVPKRAREVLCVLNHIDQIESNKIPPKVLSFSDQVSIYKL